MVDAFVHPITTPGQLGGVNSVIKASSVGSRWTIASSDPVTGLIGWMIKGYTEDIIVIRNIGASHLLVQYEGSLDRSHWVNLPVYDRETDDFLLSDIVVSTDVEYETLEQDRWPYIRVRVRTASAVAHVGSTCSYVIGIGCATI